MGFLAEHIKSIDSVAVIVLLIMVVVLLRKLGLVKEEQGPFFAKLVTQVTLPALIFTSLARQCAPWDEFWLAGWMVAAEIICLGAGYLLGKALKLTPAKLGAFILAVTFSSSALLGYALIAQVFKGDPAAMTEAVVISEIGVGPLLFTVGVMVAMYFGGAQLSGRESLSSALAYFRSPIFAAMASGFLVSVLGVPLDNQLAKVVLGALDILGAANTFAVALTVGVLLKFSGIGQIAMLAALAVAIKLILKPVLLWLPALGMDLAPWELEVLVLEAAMPSAMLSVVLSARYGCDAGLASKLVFVTTLVSALTIPIMVSLLT